MRHFARLLWTLVICYYCAGFHTVDDSQHSPEEEDDDECERLFALYTGDAFDEDKIKCKWRHDDGSIKYLYSHNSQCRHVCSADNNDKVEKLDPGSRSFRPRYCVTTAIRAGHWLLSLTFNPRRAMVMTHDPLPSHTCSKVSLFKRCKSGNKRTNRRTPPIAWPSWLTRSVINVPCPSLVYVFAYVESTTVILKTIICFLFLATAGTVMRLVVSVRLSVRLLQLCFLNRLTFEVDFCTCMGHYRSSLEIESQDHGSR